MVDVVESSVEVGEDVWEIIGRVEETQAEGEHGKKVDVKGDGVTKVENKAVLLIRKLLVCHFPFILYQPTKLICELTSIVPIIPPSTTYITPHCSLAPLINLSIQSHSSKNIHP